MIQVSGAIRAVLPGRQIGLAAGRTTLTNMIPRRPLMDQFVKSSLETLLQILGF